MKKKIALTLTTLGLAFALSACNNDTARTNQTGYNTNGTRIQSNTRGVYDPRNAMLDNRGWTNTGVRNGYQTYSIPNGTTGNTGISRYGNTNNQNAVGNYSIYKANTGSTTVNQLRGNKQSSVGYVRIGEGTGMNAKGNSATINAAQNVYVDRQMLANALAGVAKTIPEVKNVTVLTTDNQAFIGCKTKGLNANQAKAVLQKVQSQTSNICPRYYKVFTSDNQNVIDKVNRNPGSLANKTDAELKKILGQK